MKSLELSWLFLLFCLGHTMSPTSSPSAMPSTAVPSLTPTPPPTVVPTLGPEPTQLPALNCTVSCSLLTQSPTEIAEGSSVGAVALPNFFTIRFDMRGMLPGIADSNWYNVLSVVSHSEGGSSGSVMFAVDVMLDGAMNIRYGASEASVEIGMLPTNWTAPWTTIEISVSPVDTDSAEITIWSSHGEWSLSYRPYQRVNLGGADCELFASYTEPYYTSGGQIQNVRITGETFKRDFIFNLRIW